MDELAFPVLPISLNNCSLVRPMPAAPALGTMSLGRKELQVLVTAGTSSVTSLALQSASIFPTPS